MAAQTSTGSSGHPLHVTIIGAGIGGVALAVGLARKGVPFTLYEAAPAFSAIGAGIGLGPNALNALELIQPGFKELYSRISSGNITPGKDHVMMDALLVEEGLGTKCNLKPLSFGAECYNRTSAHRKDLLDILTAFIPKESVKFGKRVQSMKQTSEHCVITFEDGEVLESTCVIGSDGVRGFSRAAVLGENWPELVKGSYTGKYIYRSIIPMADAMRIMGKDAQGNEIAGDAKMFMGPECIITTFPIMRGQCCNMVCYRLDQPWPHEEWTNDVTREEMVEDIRSLGVDHRLVQLLEGSWTKPTQWGVHDHLVTPTYYNKRICLVGDVAHATTPHQAAGAGQCTEDALLLSHLLGLVTSPNQLEAAFSVYDSIRRPRAQMVVATSREAGEIYALKAPGLEADMDRVVANLNQRFLWLWEHDLAGDLAKAESEFQALVLAHPSAPGGTVPGSAPEVATTV